MSQIELVDTSNCESQVKRKSHCIRAKFSI